MSAVRFWMLGREFSLACDDGQEPHLRQLVERLKERVEALGVAIPASKRTVPAQLELLVLAAITFADESADAREALGRVQHAILPPEAKAAADQRDALLFRMQSLEKRLETLTKRLESKAEAS